MISRSFRALVALVIPGVLLACSGEASALTLREGFESWAWRDGCADEHADASACSRVTGCAGAEKSRGLLVRRVDGYNACADPTRVRQWRGGASAQHGGTTDHASEWVASSVPAQAGTLELMTSTGKQKAAASGELRADLYLHEAVPPGGAGEHYAVFHNMSLTENPSCTRACTEVADTGTGHAGDTRSDGTTPQPTIGDRQRWRFQAVIAGSFGEEPCACGGKPPACSRCETGEEARGLGFGLTGFAVEVPRSARHRRGPGRPPSDLVNESYMPYSSGGAFPAGWYRIEIRRAEIAGVDTYTYAVRRWSGSAFELVVPTDRSANPRSFPASALDRHDDAPLGPGYVGVFVAFFDPARVRAGAHVDWDRIEADW